MAITTEIKEHEDKTTKIGKQIKNVVSRIFSTIKKYSFVEGEIKKWLEKISKTLDFIYNNEPEVKINSSKLKLKTKHFSVGTFCI